MLVTMGCAEACPYVPGLQPLEWQLVDPEGKTIEEVRLQGETWAGQGGPWAGQGGGAAAGRDMPIFLKVIHKLAFFTFLRAGLLLLIDAGAGHQGPGQGPRRAAGRREGMGKSTCMTLA